MLLPNRPQPRERDYKRDAPAREHAQRARDAKREHDCEKQIARGADGKEEVTLGASSTAKFFHTLGRPARWRIVRLVAAATIAGPIYESSAVGHNDGKTLTLTNDNAIAVTLVVEVF